MRTMLGLVSNEKHLPQQLSYQLRRLNTNLNYRFLKSHDGMLMFGCRGADVALKIYTSFYFDRTSINTGILEEITVKRCV